MLYLHFFTIKPRSKGPSLSLYNINITLFDVFRPGSSCGRKKPLEPITDSISKVANQIPS